MASGAKAVVPIKAAVTRIVIFFAISYLPFIVLNWPAVMNFMPAARPVRLANGLVVEIVPIFSIIPMQLWPATTTEGKKSGIAKEGRHGIIRAVTMP
ncbi:hypothetical protein AGR9A_Lc40212 [Agrobacterium salinitolerans str. Hayward 0363]|nr:hypothetical protein AGR9A_Lc40212 [Agrobacterium salinitolerans str. Hayward 0363]